MKLEQDCRLQLNKVKNLPPLPEASVRIMNAVNDPEVSVNELVETISLSSSLVARLLGLANSAYFGQSGKINDLKKAIIQVLGLNLVKSLSLSIALNVELDARKCPSFDADYHWSQALITAVLAQKLSTKVKSEMLAPATVYTSGLLLNIGILVAVFLFPQEMHGIFTRSEKSGQSVDKEITKTLGLTHYQLGHQLLNRWKLPLVYQNVLKEFENPQYCGEEMQLIAVQQLSRTIASLINKGKPFHIEDYGETLGRLGLSREELSRAVEQIMDSKNDIRELAAIISG